MTITIANETFTTQKALRERCDAIKSTATLDAPITGADLCLLEELLPLHPDLDCPAPIAEASVFVGTLAFGKQGFYVRFPNQAPVPVGIKKAIQSAFGKGSAIARRLYDFKIAGRNAVAPQILAKRREFVGHSREFMNGTFTSELSGKEFPMSDLVIDHKPPQFFDGLLLYFVKTEGINPLTVPLLRSDGWTLIADDEIADKWRAFHQFNANLRAISATENAGFKPRSEDWVGYCLGLSK
jgi:hypothetical protein